MCKACSRTNLTVAKQNQRAARTRCEMPLMLVVPKALTLVCKTSGLAPSATPAWMWGTGSAGTAAAAIMHIRCITCGDHLDTFLLPIVPTLQKKRDFRPTNVRSDNSEVK